MADKDKFLATFRINQDEWKDFMAQAKAEGSSASAVLVDFIRWYRSGNRIAADTKRSTHLDNLDYIIDSRIEARIQAQSQLPFNLDDILDERERNLEWRLTQVLEEKLEELQGNLNNLESALDERKDKREQLQKSAQQQPMEVETMPSENEQLFAQIEALKVENQELLLRLNNKEAQERAATPLPDLQAIRSRILKSLTQGKNKVATTSPQYKTAVKVLDKFIAELVADSGESTPPSSPDV
ncbi:hypothetical protein F7734_39070 [Scytonema sp. UIC 10036]|uniref:hypothetical protein n=2 Tax=Scytonema sp. UIC 10036 TaxID=2304196 RepID=UPI0012DA8357|nr:hypothetical protein [Scytonema sp. UIC 10036]MUG97994.1 hypothetical protein [Scytonema sp. UIC 10036]